MSKTLSRRESLAFPLVIFGLTPKEAALEMQITEKATKDCLRTGARKLGYERLDRAKFVSDFFLGNIDDDQCHLVFKYFAERRLKMEREKQAGLPRGIN